MRFALFAALAALSSFLAAPAAAQCRPTTQAYDALYQQGLEREGRAAAMSQGVPRVNAYRQAANSFEQALCARDRPRTDHRIYTALGIVYLGMGDLVRADSYLQRALRNAGSLARADQRRLYTALGYLNALLGDNAAARRYYGLANSESARQSLRELPAARTR